MFTMTVSGEMALLTSVKSKPTNLAMLKFDPVMYFSTSLETQ